MIPATWVQRTCPKCQRVGLFHVRRPAWEECWGCRHPHPPTDWPIADPGDMAPDQAPGSVLAAPDDGRDDNLTDLYREE